MNKTYYFLRILQLLAPHVWGAVTAVVVPFLEGLAMFARSLWVQTEVTAEAMLRRCMDGRVLPSTWSTALYWVFRIVALLGVALMWVVLSHITVWLTRVIF